jgi:hypothetical protein
MMRDHTLRALRIDDTNPTALHHLAVIKMLFDWDWDEAERLFLKQAEMTGIASGSYAVFLVTEITFSSQAV